MSNPIYRLDIRYPRNRGGVGTKFRLLITADSSHQGIETVAEKFVADKPKMADLRAFLADNGLEAYGDMKIMSDGSLRSMARKIS